MNNIRARAASLLAATAIVGAMVGPLTASATVVYAFSDTTGDAFTFTSPTYINSVVFANGAGLVSCSGRFTFCATTGAGLFFPDFNLASGPVDEIIGSLEIISGLRASVPWAFALDAFSANGTYTSFNNPVADLGRGQIIEFGFGTLTVSGSPTVAVPEPSTLPLALLALTVVPWLHRRPGRS
jgi:hypothetical protein